MVYPSEEFVSNVSWISILKVLKHDLDDCWRVERHKIQIRFFAFIVIAR